MEFRKKVQQISEKASDALKEQRDKLHERDDRAARAMDKTEEIGRKVGQKAMKIPGFVVTKSAEAMGADKYRVELDLALQEALRVIAVQEERIAILEARLATKDRSDVG